MDGRGKRRGHVHVHVAPLTDADVVSVNGLPVTSLARTVVDLGRTLPLVQAVAAGDAALRLRLPEAELAATLDLAQGRPGVTGARRAAAMLDARSASAGESYSRVVLHHLGLPPSNLQYEVLDESGRLVGRSDFVWEEQRTLGEFDGRAKYDQLLRPGQTAAQAVYLEKLREDAMRDLGWQTVRWGWPDLQRDGVLADRLRRAFRRGAGVVSRPLSRVAPSARAREATEGAGPVTSPSAAGRPRCDLVRLTGDPDGTR